MKNLTLIALFWLTLFSCKKDVSHTPATNTNNTGGTNTTSYYGLMEAAKTHLLYYSGGTLYDAGTSSNLVSAGFSSQAYIDNGFIFGTSIEAGTVSMNGVSLKQYSPNPIRYSDTTNTIPFPIQNWVISGSSQVPAFTFTNNDSVPIYTGYNLIPDTILKATGFSLPFTGLSGCDEFQLYIASGSTNIIKKYTATTTAITVAPSELAAFPTGTIVFQLSFSKISFANAGGKNYKFKTSQLVQIGSIVLQ